MQTRDVVRSYLFNSQVPDFAERVGSKISSRLSYSCVYWISHLIGASKGTLSNKLERLLNGPQILFWLEVLSLLSRVDVGLTGLLELSDWLPVSNAQLRMKNSLMLTRCNRPNKAELVRA